MIKPDPMDVLEEDQVEGPADDDPDAVQLRKPWNKSVLPSLKLLAKKKPLISAPLSIIAKRKIKV